MKQVIILILSAILLTACKKEKTRTNCDFLTKYTTYSPADKLREFEFGYNGDGSLNNQVIKIPDNGTVTKISYSYENNGKTITGTMDDGSDKTIFTINNDGYISASDEIFGTSLEIKTYYTYDANGFLNTRTQENYKNRQTFPSQKYFQTYINTVENGNLVKSVFTNKDVTANKTDPPVTKTWEYDYSNRSYNFFPIPWFSGFQLLKGLGRQSKDRVIKYSDTQGAKFSYDYLPDANGRIKEVTITDISGGSGTANNMKWAFIYQCN